MPPYKKELLFDVAPHFCNIDPVLVTGSAVSIAVLLLLLFLPNTAYAFGPVGHLDLGLEVLAQAGVLAAFASSLLQRQRRHFLLGVLGPDRVLLKNLAPYDRHSHNWDHALRLLASAREEPERAFLLGYLCHLAADVVAHNYFVPRKIALSWHSPFARHAYWEFRYDGRLAEQGFPFRFKDLGFNEPEHLRSLARFVPVSIMKPKTNFRLTGLFLRLQDLAPYRGLEKLLDEQSSNPLSHEEHEDARTLALRAQLDILENLSNSPLTSFDPRGLAALRLATKIKHEMKRRWPPESPSHEEIRNLFRDRVACVLEGRS